MKRLILILSVLMFVASTVVAQDVTKSYALQPDQSFYSIETVDVSLTDGNQDSLYVNFTLNKDIPVQYTLNVEADSIGASSDIDYTLYGRVFDNDNWTLIETASTTTVGDDEVVETLSDIASPVWYEDQSDSTYTRTAGDANFYRHLQLRAVLDESSTSADEGVKVTNIYLKLWKRLY